MKSGVPWQVEGVRPHTRDTAREAARRAGMSVGEWLDTIILDSALHEGVDPRRSAWERYRDDAFADRTGSDARGRLHAAPTSDPLPRPRTQELSGLEQQLRQINTRIATLRQPCGLDHAVDTLRADLADIGLMLQEAMPRKAVEALEAEVRRLADRIDRTRDAGADAAAFTGIERGLAEVRDALRGLTPAENLVGVGRAVRELSRKVDRLASNAQDPSTLRQLEGAINAMRGIASHVASNEALETLSEEVRALARKVDHAASSVGAGTLSALEERIAMLADALEARNQRGQNVPDKLDTVVQGLIDKIERIELMRGDHGGLGHLEDRIATLVEKTQDAVELVHGTLGHVVARLEWIETDMRVRPAQPPERASPPAAASALFDTNVLATRAAQKSAAPADLPASPPALVSADLSSADLSSADLSSADLASAAEPIEIAAARTLRPSRPAAAERRPIEPHLPPDHPLEPGSGTARGRHAHSPADRIAADAALGGATPTVIPDPGGKSSFIAAARRAARAAGHDGPGNTTPRARGEIESAPGKRANPAEKLRALVVGAAAVVLVLGSLQVARTFLSSAGESAPGSPIPPSNAVAAAPDAPAPPLAERETTGSVAKPGQPASPPTPILRMAAANGDGEAGHAKALHNLAVLHAEGIDGKPDYQSAVNWFRKAADYGIADSQYNLAILYARGIGVEQNLSESYKWFALAARAGDPDAVKKRDDVGARLDAQSLQAAAQAAQAWRAQPQPEGAMQVTPPPGGWDRVTPSAAAIAKRKPPVAGSKPDLATPGSAQ